MLVGGAYALMVRSFESVKVDGSRLADVIKAYSICLSSNDDVSSFISSGSLPFNHSPGTKLSADERYKSLVILRLPVFGSQNVN